MDGRWLPIDAFFIGFSREPVASFQDVAVRRKSASIDGRNASHKMAGSPAAAADSDSSDEEKVEEAPAPGGPAPEAPAPAAAELPPSTRDKKKKAPPRPGNQEHQIRWDPATGEDKPRNAASPTRRQRREARQPAPRRREAFG